MTLKQDLQKFLMASYLYYTRFQSPIPDAEYDAICKRLLAQWDDFEHQHKYLVTPDDLRAGTLYTLSEDDYPMMVRQAAEMWLREGERGKKAGDV